MTEDPTKRSDRPSAVTAVKWRRAGPGGELCEQEQDGSAVYFWAQGVPWKYAVDHADFADLSGILHVFSLKIKSMDL